MIWRVSRGWNLPVGTAILFCALVGNSWAESPVDVRIPGLANSKLSEKLQGRVLLEELNCVACHASADESLISASKTSPRLANIAERINPHYLEPFLTAPHSIKPGTTMPDVLSGLPTAEKKEVAKTISHFLLSQDSRSKFALAAIDTVAAEQGAELFHTVGCVACHAPQGELADADLAAKSVPLGDLETKYSTTSLTKFLRAPHVTRPSGRMPDMKLNDREANQIANFLLRKTTVPGHLKYTLLQGKVWEGLVENVTKVSAGQVHDFELSSLRQVPGNSAIIYEGYLNVETADDYTFFLGFNGGELWLNDKKVVELEPSSRRGVKAAEGVATLSAGWNKIKLIYIHAGKEPKLDLQMTGSDGAKQIITKEQLSISPTPIEPFQPFIVDKDLAAAGKENFAKFGCVNCHNDIKVAAVMQKPLVELDTTQGCLMEKTAESEGHWPRFALDKNQTELLQAAVTQSQELKLEPAEVLDKSLVKFNCIACHDCGDLGGVSPARNHFFTGSKKELGNEGRIPPPLTLVGAKLQPRWIKEVIVNGAEQRDYLATRMPKFGESNVGHMVELFEQVDEVEEVTFPEITDITAYKAAGHQLVGTTGFSCIACHDFNGQKAAGPGALDIATATERLNKDWFYLYLLKPARFHPGTIMPESWPGGHAFKKDILDGDTKKQIESVWVYLTDGTRAKNPIGLSRKSPELRVTTEALIARGRGNAGYRGIAVGYPKQVNLAFDSEEMNLRLLWKGEFVSVREGSWSARGSDRVELPQGIPFHRLKSLDGNWSYKRKTDYLFPEDHGYKFKGYYLDAQQRPIFMYRYGEINVEEFFEDRIDDADRSFFRRTFTFEVPESAKTPDKFYFRAASGKTITRAESDAQTYTADRLTVTILGPQKGVVRDGEPNELLIPMELPKGKSTLTLDYKW
jgi:mono/diheme cytochrome c family protein